MNICQWHTIASAKSETWADMLKSLLFKELREETAPIIFERSIKIGSQSPSRLVQGPSNDNLQKG